MQGWVKLYRKILEDPVWLLSTPEQKVILITLLMMANHQEKQWIWQGQKFDVAPGQFITSIDSIKEKAGKGISTKNVRTALKRFENFNFLANKSAKTGRLITIVNWGKYQDEKPKVAKQTANSWQTAGKEVAPNKNVKNDKKDNVAKTRKRIYGHDSSAYKLAAYLFSRIKENNPNAKDMSESRLQNWADDARKLLELDKRDKKLVAEVIDWCQADSFWCTNILSVNKLRQRFDQLTIAMNGKKQSGAVSKPRPKLSTSEKAEKLNRYIWNRHSIDGMAPDAIQQDLADRNTSVKVEYVEQVIEKLKSRG